MNKYIIYAQELDTATQIISEVDKNIIEGIMKEYEFYDNSYTIINEKIDDDTWKTLICSGDGEKILEVYTKYEPFISEDEFTYMNLSKL